MTEVTQERNEQLSKRIAFANKGLIITVIATVIVIIATLGVLVAQNIAIQQQLTTTLKQGQDTGTANHKRTQQYIRCLALVLLQPIQDRTEAAFDKCSVTGNYDKNAADQGDTGTNTPATPQAVVPPSVTPAPSTQQTTTSGGPDPNSSTPTNPSSILKGVTDPVNNGINNIFKLLPKL